MRKTDSAAMRLTTRLLASLLACLALVLSPTWSDLGAASSVDRTGPKPTIVLVHGDWADASSWNAVIRRLQAHGYTVVAPPNPLRGPTSDAAYIASFLET